MKNKSLGDQQQEGNCFSQMDKTFLMELHYKETFPRCSNWVGKIIHAQSICLVPGP